MRGNKGTRFAQGRRDRVAIGRSRAGELLEGLRNDLKANRFVPQWVRDKAISNASGKIRRLRKPTTADRIVQAASNLMLEPISKRFPAVFQRLLPETAGPRPGRRNPLPRITSPQLRVGDRGRDHGMFRRDRSHRLAGADVSTRREQTRDGLGKGVPASLNPGRTGPEPGNDYQHSPGFLMRSRA